MKHWIATLLACVGASGASAEVMNAAPGGFEIQHEVVIAAERSVVWRVAVNGVGHWWHDDHTISGDSARMSIDARPLGCFDRCEAPTSSSWPKASARRPISTTQPKSSSA